MPETLMKKLVLVISVVLGIHISPAQWVQQTSGTPENLVDIIMLDSMKALVIGDRNGILLTTDAGATWINESAIVSAVYRWNGISFSDAFNGTIVGDHRVVTTTDGGLTWALRTAPSTRKCLSVLNLGAGYMYVGADSGWMYHSLDTGKTWTSEKISAWPVRSLFMWPGIYIFGLPIYALTPYSLCNKYEFPSGPWKETILSNFQGLGSEAFSGEFCRGGGPAFIVGVWGDLRSAPAIVRKSASDTAWQGVAPGILRDGALLDVSAPSANVIYVCGTAGMIFKSMNGGDAWTAAEVPTNRNLNSIYFYDEKRGFAVGDSGTILHTENGGDVIVAVGKEPLVSPNGFRLEQNYPNPFNPVTVISYQLKVKSYLTITVCDLLGRKVATLVDQERSAGNYTVQWDASNLPGGVYFYRLYSSGFVETKKMVLMK
jgi:hypothetical protein